MNPRVFVSSVIEGFNEYRMAAKAGIKTAGGVPILLEDYPALSQSPRNSCLDGVASCDVCIVILGGRGGWKAPSGKLVVEEEYEEARRRKLRVLVFAQDVKRDQEAHQLLNRLSDYVEGSLRPTFTTPQELQSAVEKALLPIIPYYNNPEVKTFVMDDLFENPYVIYQETSLRFAIMLERDEEFIDPVLIESKELERQLLDIGHGQNVELFSYKLPKSTEVGINNIVILQSEERRGKEGTDDVRLELRVNGSIIIDMNITNRPSKKSDLDFGVLEQDIKDALQKCFAFSKNFYDIKDPFKRYNRLFFNTALIELGYRTIMASKPKTSSYPMRMNNDDKVIMAFDKPRLLTREDLLNPTEQIDGSISLFYRRSK